ncbi:MAG TPA: IS66 family transposase [Rhodospirillales bacterium]|nr:IS66 family transposase [Rhodospirillales bacterium]
MMTMPELLPADLAEAHAMILAERAARLAAEAEAAIAKETKRVLDLEIERLKLEIARLRRQRFGSSSERSARLEQLELALTELQETAAQADAAAELRTAERSPTVHSTAAPRKPARRRLPEHLPRTRVVYPAPATCPCCGGAVRKLGEEITESLERLPARWFVIQHVREKVSCRCCEAISEAPAPFHPIARGRAGPNLLAEVIFGKYGMHLPLNRQSACFAREGIELDVSTLADWVGAVAASLQPLTNAIEAHVRAAARIHADETPVPVLAKGKTKEGRLWTVVRDDRPFSGPDPPVAVFFYSPDRSGAHAERFLAGWTGIMQADAFSGFGRLYKAGRKPGPITEAGCWAHGRRGFFELAELQKGPIAIEAVKRIDALFAVEREINGASAEQRLAVRGERSRPLILDLEAWLRDQHARLSAKSKTAKAIDYLLKRWPAFTRFLDDGRVCISNNAAERALRGIAVGRRNWTFAGSDEGGRRAAAMYTLIETAKLNGIDPRAWLASVLARLPGHPASRIHELLPWHWQKTEPISAAA